MNNYKINADVGEFRTLTDAVEYFLDNAASFASDIYAASEAGNDIK